MYSSAGYPRNSGPPPRGRLPPQQGWGPPQQSRGRPASPPRPRNVKVLTNSFVIESLPTHDYNQYTVSFSPPEEKALKRHRLVHALQTHETAVFHKRALYDGGELLFTPDNIFRSDFRVHGSNQDAAPDAKGWYTITLTRTAKKAITSDTFGLILAGNKSPEAAMATNLVQMLFCQTQNKNQPGNKKAFFFEEGKKLLDNMAIELHHGYFQYVRPTLSKLVVTVDTTMAAMYMSGKLIDVALRVLNTNRIDRLASRNPRDDDLLTLLKFLKGRQIYVKTSGHRVKTIRDLVPGPVGDISFRKDQGGPKTTVKDHYRDAYNIHLRYPETIGVVTSGHSAPFQIVVPLELCTVVAGQPYRKKLPPSAGPAVIAFSSLRPQERLAHIEGGAYNRPSPVKSYATSEVLVDAGVSVHPTAMLVSGRLLEVPRLLYRENRELVPENGAWNVLNNKFYLAASMTKWGLVCFERTVPDRAWKYYTDQIRQCCSNLGMNVAPVEKTAMVYGNGQAVDQSMQDVLQKLGGEAKNVDMIIVILPDRAEDIRNQVKYWGDIKCGVRTQCLRITKIPREGDRSASQYFNNVALKLNARLPGGLNARVNSDLYTDVCRTQRFMIFGADVSHPAPGSAQPSVASVVWSHDRLGGQYAAATCLQRPRLEIIERLQAMVKYAIDTWGNKNQNTPTAIFFYRDGVSEGEFEKVKEYEIRAIERAIDQVWQERKIKENFGTAKPTITFLVVGKRHHVSFFPPKDDPTVGDRTGNCKAGLVVDQDLRNPRYKDFFLQSHAAIKGTSRSAHYTVLRDDNFQEDLPKLEELSFALCHIYARATRSVSIPAPCYYADLACARGKFHLAPGSRLDFEGSTTSGGDGVDMDAWGKAFGYVHNNLAGAMYFL